MKGLLLVRKILVFVFPLLLVERTVAQNLVPNPSFEDTIICPYYIGAISACEHWSTYGNSVDYYHSCSSTLTVPNLPFGFQYPHTGEAMTAIITYVWQYSPGWPDYREYLGVKLSDTLIVGHEYFASFYFNLAGYLPGWQIIAANKIGLKFSTIPFDSLTPPPLNNFAHLYTDSIITDTIGWHKISGSFIADSAYAYLIIGNFFDTLYTDTIIFGGPPFGGSASYYYIDDVCVLADSKGNCGIGVSVPELFEPPALYLFPNPTSSLLHFTIPSTETIQQIIISTSDGRIAEVLGPSSIQDDKKINVSHLVPGFYLLQIKTANSTFFSKFIKN